MYRGKFRTKNMGDWGRGKEADAESGRGELLTFVILQSSFIGLQVPSCIASHAKVNLSLLLGFFCISPLSFKASKVHSRPLTCTHPTIKFAAYFKQTVGSSRGSPRLHISVPALQNDGEIILGGILTNETRQFIPLKLYFYRDFPS